MRGATTEPVPLDLLDHRSTDWDRVECSTYVVRQRVCYDYPAPGEQLRQRLMMVPPAHHGDQTRVRWAVETSSPAKRRTSVDRFGNLRVDFEMDVVAETVHFDSVLVLERAPRLAVRSGAPHPSLRQATPLTAPDEELVDAAQASRAVGHDDLGLAERICEWASRRLRYEHGVTDVTTTAVEACHYGVGVCQDYAHIMLALCRSAGLAARYVSGHLLGEGPSHAWVEVVVPTSGGWAHAAFDPTHARRSGLDYLTIATGRDYRDVAPTSGTCLSAMPGVLRTAKQAAVIEVQYRAG